MSQKGKRKQCFFSSLPSPLNLRIELRIMEVVIIAEHTEGVLGEELLRGWPVARIAIITQNQYRTNLYISHTRHRRKTYTVKQSHMKASATGLTSALTSSGIGGLSPLAIL